LKAEKLFKLPPKDLQADLNGLPGGLGIELVRNVVEYAVDILLIPRDPAIGAKVSAAALLRDPEFPQLLSAAFPAMAAEIVAAATQFKHAMISYGQMLALGQLVAVLQISDQAASLAQQLYGVSIDSNTIRSAIITAMWLCALDYTGAINATINGVRAQMVNHGFNY
jgi:hypothetical protein